MNLKKKNQTYAEGVRQNCRLNPLGGRVEKQRAKKGNMR